MPLVQPPSVDRIYALVCPEEPSEQLSTLDASLVKDIYETHGAVLFRGFALDLDCFRQFTEKFCSTSVFNESAGRETVDAARNIQTVNLGTDPFPLHPELSREPWKPDVCFFACQVAPTIGGETVICDGVDLVRNLPSDFAEALRTRRLIYIRPVEQEELLYWFGTHRPTKDMLSAPASNCPFSFRLLNGRLVRYFTAPFFHKTMFSEDSAFGSFLLFARYYLNNNQIPLFDDGSIVPDELLDVIKKVGDRLTVAISWEENDLIMLDNSRFMHGRNKIVDSNGRLIYSHFGYLKFAKPSAEEPPNAPWRECTWGALTPLSEKHVAPLSE